MIKNYIDLGAAKDCSINKNIGHKVCAKLSDVIFIFSSCKNKKEINDYLTLIGLDDRSSIISEGIHAITIGRPAASFYTLIFIMNYFFKNFISKTTEIYSYFPNKVTSLDDIIACDIFENENTANIIKGEFSIDFFDEFYYFILSKNGKNYMEKAMRGYLNYNELSSSEVLYVIGLCLYAIFYKHV